MGRIGEAFADLGDEVGAQRPGPRCWAARLINELDEDEVAELKDLLASEATAQQVVVVLRAAGYDVTTRNGVERHRKRHCRCR